MELLHHVSRSGLSCDSIPDTGLPYDMPQIMKQIVEDEADYARSIRKCGSDLPDTRYVCHGIYWTNTSCFLGHIVIEPDYSSVCHIEPPDRRSEIAIRLIVDAIATEHAEASITLELIELDHVTGFSTPLVSSKNTKFCMPGEDGIYCTLEAHDRSGMRDVCLVARSKTTKSLIHPAVQITTNGLMDAEDGSLYLAVWAPAESVVTDSRDYPVRSSMPLWRNVIPRSKYSPETYGAVRAAMRIL